MLTNVPRFQESSERAKALQLESLIQKLSKQEDQRQATRKQIEQRRTALLRQIDDPLMARTRLERILQGNELTDINYLAQGVLCSRSVCRIVIRRNQRLFGYGTGFLIAPGVLLTNHHVLPTVDDVRDSIAQFRYERDLAGRELAPTDFALRIMPEPIIFKDLDIALVAVEPLSINGESLNQYGWLKLNPQQGKAFIGEYLTIIQHPNGERKQVCVRENKLLKYSENGPYLWYQTDTVAGSSGSPVFNNSWDFVALHHSSVPKTKRVNGQDVWLAKNGQPWTDEMGEDQINWIANEGVRISRIVQYLQSQHGSHPLAQKVLTANELSPDELLFDEEKGLDQIRMRTDGNGNTRILLPIEISVKVGPNERAIAPFLREAPPEQVNFSSPVRVIEKVDIDQTSYGKRNGYNPKFLGNSFAVPLPKVGSTKFGEVLAVNGSNAELKYWNYSTVMNHSRRLAYFSAANVDPNKFQGNRDADGDTWYLDTRIDKNAQIGNEFYKKQREFEADRTLNPFDQGHLTRRKDLQWGDDDEEAKRNGDDSYHYTNCSPQHWQFNQNNKANGIWFRLEESAINLSNGSRLCLINGPIFDAPLCTPGTDGRLHLNLKGKRVPDGIFGGVKIPKMFFKVIAYRAGNELRAKAFVVTQEDLLTTIDRYYPAERAPSLSDLEVRLYQVKVADLEALTGLDFGGLSKYDVPAGEESLMLSQGLPIEEEGDLSF